MNDKLRTNVGQISFGLTFIVFLLTNTISYVKAQVPDQIRPQDIVEPQSSPFPETSPQPSPPPENLLESDPSPNPEEIPGVDRTILVKCFQFANNEVFNASQLVDAIQGDSSDSEVEPINIQLCPETPTEATPQPFSFLQLDQITRSITTFYNKQGYQTSGAIINLGETLPSSDRPVTVTIEVIEGTLVDIEVGLLEDNSQAVSLGENRGRLGQYVRSRLGVDVGKPLNVEHLIEALQILQLDPLIANISARLEAGTERGQSKLIVGYRPAPSFNPQIQLNNSRSPSVGSFQRGVILREGNLLGFGDSISLGYDNTDGSDGFNGSYTIPLNPLNGTLSFAYSQTDNEVIEPPFDDIDGDGNSPDIESESRTYELTLRQPIIRNIDNNIFQEFSLGLTASLRESKTFLLDTGFPLSPGAEEDGFTRIFALRFTQEYTQQSDQDIIALRSQFSIGLNAFDSTINEQIPGVEDIPDSEFFAWRGQAQYVRRLAPETLLFIRGNLQFADQGLVSSEQFGLGGFGSVRGYRQDQLLTDNGAFISAEVQVPIVRIPSWNSTVQIIPFVDYGTTWNSSDRPNPDPKTLSSLGLGLQWLIDDNFRARLDYGIPLVDVDGRDRTWQEQGLYFTVQYNPF